MALLDDFNRADSTTLGGNWVEDQNQAEIKGNKLAPTTLSAEILVRNTTPVGSADVEVEATITYANGHAGGPTWRINAASPTQNYYIYEAENDGVFQMYRRVNGTYTSIGSHDNGPNLTDPVLKARSVGNEHKGYVNGVEVISVTDAFHPNEGQVGFRFNSGAGGTWRADDLHVTALGAAAAAAAIPRRLLLGAGV